MFIDQKQRQTRVVEAPHPDVLAVDAPAGLVRMNHRFGLQQFKPPLDHRIDEIAGPRNVPQHTGETQLQPEHLVEQRGGLAQRDPQMRPAIAHQQPGARPDIGVGVLGRSRRLRHLATARATLSMPPITRDFHTRWRDVFDGVFVERVRVFERSSTVETDLASQVVKMSLGLRGYPKRFDVFC